jgi:hypothetical protein
MFAASSMKSGALSPTCKVLLLFSISEDCKTPKKTGQYPKKRGNQEKYAWHAVHELTEQVQM